MFCGGSTICLNVCIDNGLDPRIEEKTDAVIRIVKESWAPTVNSRMTDARGALQLR